MTKLGLASLVSVGVPVACLYIVSSETADRLVRVSGYWWELGLFLSAAILASRCAARKSVPSWNRMWRAHRVGLGVAVLISASWHVHEAHEFKVLFDEHTYTGISRTMHLEREASYPIRAHHFDGRLVVLNSQIDKRPVLFPFLVSVVHDLSGYRVGNAILLNAGLGFVVLVAAYAVCFMFGGPRAGLLGVLLLGGLPLLAESATGAGYDVLNLTLMLVALAASVRYLASAGARGMDMVVLAVMLLAQVRYESILFVLVLPALFLAKWLRVRVVRITWFTVVAPVFLALPLLAHRVFMARPGLMESGASRPFFSVAYVADNVAHAARFLLDPGWSGRNSILLAVAGGGTLAVLLVRRSARWNSGRRVADLGEQVVVLFSAIIAINAGIVLCNFWGQLDDPVVSRFSLPLFALFTVALATIGSRWCRSAGIAMLLVALLCLRVVLLGVPVWRGDDPMARFPVGREYAFLLSETKTRSSERTLVVCRGPIGVIVAGYPTIPFDLARAWPWKLRWALESGYYGEVLVMQSVVKGADAGDESIVQGTHLPEGFVLETIRELALGDRSLVRLSRLAGFSDLAASVPPAYRADASPPTEAIERRRWIVEALP